MSTQVEPLANSWYVDLDTEEEFRVVAVQEDEGIVEVQYRDGELEQIDLDLWNEMDLEAAEASDDWADDDSDDDDDDDEDEDEDEEDDWEEEDEDYDEEEEEEEEDDDDDDDDDDDFDEDEDEDYGDDDDDRD